jgi:hypothetical protein
MNGPIAVAGIITMVLEYLVTLATMTQRNAIIGVITARDRVLRIRTRQGNDDEGDSTDHAMVILACDLRWRLHFRELASRNSGASRRRISLPHHCCRRFVAFNRMCRKCFLALAI